MTRDVAHETPIDREKRHRHDGRRQDDVGNQDGEINGAECARAAERHRPDSRVVRQISDEEHGRQREGARHGEPVPRNVLLLDEVITHGQ